MYVWTYKYPSFPTIFHVSKEQVSYFLFAFSASYIPLICKHNKILTTGCDSNKDLSRTASVAVYNKHGDSCTCPWMGSTDEIKKMNPCMSSINRAGIRQNQLWPFWEDLRKDQGYFWLFDWRDISKTQSMLLWGISINQITRWTTFTFHLLYKAQWLMPVVHQAHG